MRERHDGRNDVNDCPWMADRVLVAFVMWDEMMVCVFFWGGYGYLQEGLRVRD